MSNWPDIAVIMPVLNEESYLKNAITSILKQNYKGKMRIVLSIGPSNDNSINVAKDIASSHPEITILESPTGRTPESLNLAIADCKNEEIVARVDAHSELSNDYLSSAVETLQRTGADNVGGIMGAIGETNFEKAVAAAMSSPLGVGSAAFHTGGDEGPAETVYLGVFKKSALERVGGFDTNFSRAQDWELNHRIRSSGGLVWFNPKLFVTYRPRPNIKKLAAQYFQYGMWRREVMRKHSETMKRKSALRYFAPPFAVIGICLGLGLGLIGLIQNNLLFYGFLFPLGYLTINIISSTLLMKKAESGLFWLPPVLATMQISWGLGFLFGKFFINLTR